MNFAQENNSSSRLTGFGVVVLIHVLMAYALASGLAKKVVQAIAPIETKVIEEVKKPPPPVEKVVPPPPDMKAPPPPFIPPPEVQVTAPAPAPTISTQSQTPPPKTDVHPAPPPAPVAAPAPAPRVGPKTAAMVCTKMGKPEVPSVNWSGRAEFKATATVKAGRVVSVELAVIRGASDRKAQRAMQNAISQALADTYECPGDHVFEQDFVFNIE
ncbi:MULTISPECIES: ABC transporter substrate-binding protein [Roseateles]|uniref:ABC transporter substrate-binding protein n=1 Tax=Roseateles flavus TaxID=3149041 RepID=A0ABV0GI94_9BURK|nr:ABC transporter substrate-binding protein [Pelomonas sp. BJYL3]